MPIGNVGPVCEVPGCSATRMLGYRLCAGHMRLAKMFGRDPGRFTSFEAAKLAGWAHEWHTLEFERELNEWRKAA